MNKEILYALLDKFTTTIAYDASDNPEYIGDATPGSATSAAVWRIKKITWDSGNPTNIQWASGTQNYDKIWDDRGDYVYS